MSGRGAAFFDLDRTLMSGSSGAQFGRAAYRAGLVSRGQVVALGRSTTCGSGSAARPTRTPTRSSRQVNDLLRGVPERTLRRMLPGPARGHPAADLPADARRGPLPSGRRPAGLHRQRREQRRRRGCSPGVLDMEGGIGTRYEVDDDGPLHRAADRRPQLRRAQGRADAALRRRPRHRPRRRAGRTPTRSPTCRCCELVGNPVAVNPDAPLARVAAERGWPVMRFEKLGRTLAAAGALAVATLVGGGSVVARRRSAARPAPLTAPPAAG